MENNVHELKAVENENTAAKAMPLNDLKITFFDTEFVEDVGYVNKTQTFEAVEMFNVTNGFLMVIPQGGNMQAFNVDAILSIEQLPAKEQN